MAQPDSTSTDSPTVALSGTRRLLLRLVWLYGGLAAALGVFLVLRLFRLPAITPVVVATNEGAESGVAGLVLATLLMVLTALVATLAIVAARQHPSSRRRVLGVGFRKWRVQAALPATTIGFVGRTGQAAIVTAGAVLLCVLFWKLSPPLDLLNMVLSKNTNVLAAIAIGLAFPALVSERAMAAVSETVLPEAPSLRRLLLIATVIFALAGGLQILRGVGYTWAIWPTWALTWVPALIAVELALRALARLFLPEPSAAAARASTESILADVLTRGPRAPAQLIRTHLGIDFSRSWALSYLSSALAPALVVTVLFCWFLTGLKLIGTSERGVYEQFGAPVAVLGPGLHVLAPWPFGRVHPVELGTIHSVATGTDEAADPAEDIGAEDTPPTSLNRLWTTQHATQAQYLVASESGDKQTFQTVNTEILVLYRTGLTDADAMQAVYGVVNQQDVVRQAASRLALRYFSSRTLEMVMGAQRESLEETLRTEISKDVAAAKGGIEIVGVVIEEIHPPAGAAAAYHAVQAAEINSKASISTEIGKAEGTSGAAQSQATQLLTAAEATAAETVQAATGEAYRFAADKSGYDLSPRSFLMEHQYRNLADALSKTPLTIIDHRLKVASGTVIDMRASRGAQGAAKAPSTPDTSAADPAISDDQTTDQSQKQPQ